jgi:hypothetical protein
MEQKHKYHQTELNILSQKKAPDIFTRWSEEALWRRDLLTVDTGVQNKWSNLPPPLCEPMYESPLVALALHGLNRCFAQ